MEADRSSEDRHFPFFSFHFPPLRLYSNISQYRRISRFRIPTLPTIPSLLTAGRSPALHPMDHGDVLHRFSGVTFHYDPRKPILDAVDFSVREQAKVTIMGQNGAGKSTIFKLIMGELKQQAGEIHRKKGSTVGIAKQVIPHADLEKTVEQFFTGAFSDKKFDLERHIKKVLDAVHLRAPLDKKLKEFSGGQKARLLLAFALIQEPDLLLLDEPTHNLDAHAHKVQQFVGDYLDVVEKIQAQIEREQHQNARMEKDILDQKEKINFFSHKGGKMRKLASKMRGAVEEAEDNKVDVDRKDKTIVPFTIEAGEFPKPLVHITSVTVMQDHKPVKKNVELTIRRRHRVLITGPNGIGKSSLLEGMTGGKEKGAKIAEGVTVGYYRQDFSGLPMDKTVYDILH